MREDIGAADRADYRSATRDLPILTTERLDADPHGIFRLYRCDAAALSGLGRSIRYPVNRHGTRSVGSTA
jgi:hypothetical protein